MIGLLEKRILHLRIRPTTYRTPDHLGKYRMIAGAAESEKGHHLIDWHKLPIFQISALISDHKKNVDICGGKQARLKGQRPSFL